MGQKILVAIDDSENAMRAVELIAKSFTPDHRITLFSVILDTPAICDMNNPSLTPYFLYGSKNGILRTGGSKEVPYKTSPAKG
jgi:nucleotide-binding universal stress UspA family protein